MQNFSTYEPGLQTFDVTETQYTASIGANDSL